MATVGLASPILPGKQEEWRRFCQVLQGSRRAEYEESRRRLGITRELEWLAQAPRGEVVIVYLEVEHPEQLLTKLATSQEPFDCWLRKQLLELHGLDLAQMLERSTRELILAWQA